VEPGPSSDHPRMDCHMLHALVCIRKTSKVNAAGGLTEPRLTASVAVPFAPVGAVLPR